MDLNEDIIRRWLSQMAEDAPPQLDPEKVDASRARCHSDLGGPDMGGPEVEQVEGPQKPSQEEDLVRRLWLVQGLLSTLDAKPAPDSLDQRVRDAAQGRSAVGIRSGDSQLDWESLDAEWSEGMAAPGAEDSEDVPVVAPEFLDRIVEQRLSEIEDQLKRSRSGSKSFGRKRGGSRHQRSRQGLRFATLIGAAALVLFLMPWSALYQGETKAPLRVIQHTSVESLFSAHPDSVQMATRSGDFGALMGLSIPEGPAGGIR